jgi:hypothetical protein
MLSGVQLEGYGGNGYGVRKGKVCDVERCAEGRLWGSWVWGEGEERMCTGYRYGVLLCDVRQITV